MWQGRDSSFLWRVRAVAGVALAALAVLAGAAGAARAAPHAWQNSTTGLAIDGYDPLAYFMEGAARQGREGVELHWGGAIWRFRNTGNRGAFERDPQVYAPRFAGYDAYAVSQGLTTRGNPQIWVRYKDKIYLFYNAVNLRLWREKRDEVIKQAEQKWPALSATLPSSIGD